MSARERVAAWLMAKKELGYRHGVIDMYSYQGEIHKLNEDDIKALVSTAERHEQLVRQVRKLMQAAGDHHRLEGVGVEIRTDSGWVDLEPLLAATVRNQ